MGLVAELDVAKNLGRRSEDKLVTEGRVAFFYSLLL